MNSRVRIPHASVPLNPPSCRSVASQEIWTQASNMAHQRGGKPSQTKITPSFINPGVLGRIPLGGSLGFAEGLTKTEEGC